MLLVWIFILCFTFVFNLLSCQFLAALWSSADKVLTSWLSCVCCFLVFYQFLVWCLGSSVALDCIDSWFLSSLLWYRDSIRDFLPVALTVCKLRAPLPYSTIKKLILIDLRMSYLWAILAFTVKPVINDHSQKDRKLVFKTKSLITGQKYCRMLQREHSALLSICIKLPFAIKSFVLSSFQWSLKTGLLDYSPGS